MTQPKSKKGIEHNASGTLLKRRAVSGGGALGVQGHYLLGDLLYVGDPDQGYVDLRSGIICTRHARGENHDVAGAVGTLAVLDADNISRWVGFDGTVAAAGYDDDTIVDYGVDGAAPLAVGRRRG